MFVPASWWVGVRQSALSKYRRMPRADASKAMFWTGVRAGFVYHIALFLFEEAYLAIRWITQAYNYCKMVVRLEDEKKDDNNNNNDNNDNNDNNEKNEKKGKGRRYKAKQIINPTVFFNRTITNLITCILAIFAEGLGASVGTIVSPGFGSLVGSRLGSLIPYYLF